MAERSIQDSVDELASIRKYDRDIIEHEIRGLQNELGYVPSPEEVEDRIPLEEKFFNRYPDTLDALVSSGIPVIYAFFNNPDDVQEYLEDVKIESDESIYALSRKHGISYKKAVDLKVEPPFSVYPRSEEPDQESVESPVRTEIIDALNSYVEEHSDVDVARTHRIVEGSEISTNQMGNLLSDLDEELEVDLGLDSDYKNRVRWNIAPLRELEDVRELLE